MLSKMDFLLLWSNGFGVRVVYWWVILPELLCRRFLCVFFYRVVVACCSKLDRKVDSEDL